PRTRLALTLLSFTRSLDPPVLPSFPTRRSSDLQGGQLLKHRAQRLDVLGAVGKGTHAPPVPLEPWLGVGQSVQGVHGRSELLLPDRKSTRLNSSHVSISYAVFCLKKKKRKTHRQ